MPHPARLRAKAATRLSFGFAVALACASCGDTAATDAPTDLNTSTSAQKSGLDGPAVPVAPFLNGNLPSRTPLSLETSEWTTTNAFPNVQVTNTIAIASNQSEDRLYVGAQDGLIVSFESDENVTGTQFFFDMRDRVAVVFEGGLMGLAFHPEFGTPGSEYRRTFYAYYSSHCLLDALGDSPDLQNCDDSYPRDRVNGFSGQYLRLSRFEVFDGTIVADPSSEQVMINFRIEGGVHRGGGLDVDDEGYLYLAIGDHADRFSAQDIEDGFDGGVLRLAVNIRELGNGSWTCPPGSHMPRRELTRSDEVSGRHYCVPDDNPWLDPAEQSFEEYCAIGLRNPFRLSVDRLTQRVWVGDVGESNREEVDIIECGNNYGWPYREGNATTPNPLPSSYLGTLTPPVVDFPRAEARSITGGYVYRGSQYPELYGKYIAGDFSSRRIWAVELDETTLTGTTTLLTTFQPGRLATFGQDRQGEVYFADIYGTGLVYELERTDGGGSDAPARLSETGAFSNTSALVPSSFWVPYGLNQPFWSDGALKTRFIALPNDGNRNSASERIGFVADGPWSYPVGTVFMKHFELQLDENDPTSSVRLETRLLTLGDDGEWYGLTYRWRANQQDADLLTSSESANFQVREADGGLRTQTWTFPSRIECLQCHTDNAGGALGLRTHQLNGDFEYPSTGRTDNQLVSWNALSMFDSNISGQLSSLPRMPSAYDVTAPLQDRARSWLDSNCAYCHQPGGVDAGFDARYLTPFSEQNMLWTVVREDLGNPDTVVLYPGSPSLSALWVRSASIGGVAMPPLAKARAEQPAVDLLESWIESLGEPAATCGDDVLDADEICDDGNNENGDGCSATCTVESGTWGRDITDRGRIIARVLSPTGAGNPDIEVIRDEDRPSSCTDSARQYDTYDGNNSSSTDWIGYEFDGGYLFGRIMFQEGREFSNGGFFEPGTLTVEVLLDEEWREVSDLRITPAYSAGDGVGCETYEITFATIAGNAVRLIGAPGGSADFISVAELDVYGPDAWTVGCSAIRGRSPLEVLWPCVLLAVVAIVRRRKVVRFDPRRQSPARHR